MTPSELVTCNDLEKMKESILKAMEAMLHPAEPYLSFDQAVDYLKTTARSLKDRVRAREIPYIKDGKFIKFRRKDLDAYMESHRVTPIEELRMAV
jgi:excisionase family DNA binding protein